MLPLLAIGALAVGVGAWSSAQADVLRNLQPANWFAGAYPFDGTRTFSHCASATRDHAIMVAGPSTLTALLNAIRVGFRSALIHRQAGEISKILQKVRKEFEVYGEAVQTARTQRYFAPALGCNLLEACVE